ncbi:MAG: hypothetical protein ORN28_03865 [Rhodoferax sp.]|nr:hypothetical protein [Rhodoferax sp.]
MCFNLETVEHLIFAGDARTHLVFAQSICKGNGANPRPQTAGDSRAQPVTEHQLVLLHTSWATPIWMHWPFTTGRYISSLLRPPSSLLRPPHSSLLTPHPKTALLASFFELQRGLYSLPAEAKNGTANKVAAIAAALVDVAVLAFFSQVVFLFNQEKPMLNLNLLRRAAQACAVALTVTLLSGCTVLKLLI